jgi:uncharacterized protein
MESNQRSMIEKDITINSNESNLSGTLCLPTASGSFPLVLMIAGSGPLDRDENMPGQQLNIFNTIAHSLANDGIASLRYDKRGCGKSEGDFYRTGHTDLVNDAINWFDFLKEQEYCEKIFVLGHSEGCIIAPQVALKRQETAGLILLSPFAENIESILIKQAAQIQKEFESGGLIRKLTGKILGATVASQQKLIHRLKSTDSETIRAGLQKIPAKSFRELMQLDPSAIFSQVSQPMLVIGGEKDLQCNPADVERIAKLAKGSVDAHVVKNLTHVLRFDEGEPSILGTSKLISNPIEPIVTELITGWFKKQLA